MITYLNISIYNQKFKLIKDTYEKSKYLCNNIKQEGNNIYFCTQTLNYHEVQVPNLFSKIESIKDLIGHSRGKRGWFNGIGSMFKTIFGTLDSDDARYYDEVISKVNSDENTIFDLMKSQIQVVKTTITNFNETIKNMKFTEQKINENIKMFNEYSKKQTNAINKLKMFELINEHLILLTYLVNELNEELDNLINAILFAKKNVIHPTVITPIQLIAEIRENKIHISNGLTFPIEPTLENAHTLMDISELTVYYMNGKLVFIIQIPLSDDILFNLFHLIPLPMPHSYEATSFAYVQPSFKFIALSVNKLNYVQLHNLDNCKTLNVENYLCKMNMYYSVNSDSNNCEISFLVSKRNIIPKNCNTKVILGNMEIFHKLKYNNWISINSKEKRITILCKNQDKIMDETIQGTSLITLNEMCKAYTDSIILKPDNYITMEYTPIIPVANIIDDDCCQKGKLNISHEYFSLKPIVLSNVNLDELNVATHTLNNMNDKIEEAQNHPHLIRYPSIFTFILYFLLCIVLLFVFFKFYKKCKRYCGFDRNGSNSNCIVKIFNQCNTKKKNYVEPTIMYRVNKEGYTDDSDIEIENPNNEAILGPTNPFSDENTIKKGFGRSFNIKN